MSLTTEPEALVSRFENRHHAAHFVAELKQAGFGADEVGLVSPRAAVRAGQILRGARAGVLAGALLGIFAGAVLGGTFPGIPAVMEGNRFMAILYAAAVCAVGGVIVGALLASFVPPEEAGEGDSTLRPEETLVVVQSADPDRQQRALEILEHSHASLP